MQFYVLESGSKGNSTVIISNGHAIMIDDGLSTKKMKLKLQEKGLDINSIEALLITHNHRDHILGVDTFKKEITYATSLTHVDIPVSNELIPFEEYSISNFKITVVPTSHDAQGSIGFIIEADNQKLVYITDTGYIYEKVVDMICNADYYIFESNHNIRMLIETNRPQRLKKRIMGDYGHLSNEDSANYLCDVIGQKTKQIFLAHLSEEANSHEQCLKDVMNVFDKRGVNYKNIQIKCCSQQDTIDGGEIEAKING